MSDRIDRYQIVRLIARGRTSIVHLAEDIETHRAVALRVFARNVACAEPFRARMRHVGSRLAHLAHPNVGRLIDAGGRPSGDAYIAMAFYEGLTLRERMNHGRLAVSDAVTLIDDVASGVAAIHDRGVVIGDLRPTEIIVSGTARA